MGIIGRFRNRSEALAQEKLERKARHAADAEAEKLDKKMEKDAIAAAADRCDEQIRGELLSVTWTGFFRDTAEFRIPLGRVGLRYEEPVVRTRHRGYDNIGDIRKAEKTRRIVDGTIKELKKRHPHWSFELAEFHPSASRHGRPYLDALLVKARKE